MKLLQRKKIDPISVLPGDSILLTYTDEKGKKTTILSEEIKFADTFDTAVAFTVEKEDITKDTLSGLGGAFLRTKK